MLRLRWVAAACAALLGVVVLAAASGEDDKASLMRRFDAPSRGSSASAAKSTPTPKPKPIPLRRLVGQRVMAGFAGLTPPRSVLRQARRGELGGVILFYGNISSPSQVRRLTARLQRAARRGHSPPLLIAVDQEGGSVHRFATAPPSRSAAQMGATGSTATARHEGRDTGRFLRSVGVNLDLAPVADLGLPGGFITADARAFSSDPRAVADFAGAFVAGLHAGGVWATAKHFPGLGTAPVSTDIQAASLPLTRAQLERNLIPYRALIAGGVDVVMLSMASYPTIARGGRPAALTRSIYALLRERLRFGGLTITDSLAAPSGLAPGTVALKAARAGADVLLAPGSGRPAYAALIHAARAGQLSRTGLMAAYRRILAAKARLPR